jgi:hypothetical protein
MIYGGDLKSGKIGKIGNVFGCEERTNNDMAKQRPLLDRGSRIGLYTSSKEKLMVGGECFMEAV